HSRLCAWLLFVSGLTQTRRYWFFYLSACHLAAIA
ncbi:MAG: hypothetical protein ACI9RY_001683, partial [Reinekea sp.]